MTNWKAPGPDEVHTSSLHYTDRLHNTSRVVWLLEISGVTRVFGTWGQEQWSAPPLKVVTWVWRQQSVFWSNIPSWLYQAANYPAILWFSFKSMLSSTSLTTRLHDWAVSSEYLGFLFLVPSLLFLFGSMRQTKLAIHQLFEAHKYSVSYRIHC